MIQGELFERLSEAPPQVSDETRLAQAFEDALLALLRKKPKPTVESRFYPYVGLSSTIRRRQGRVFARVSDLLRAAPQKVLYSLACILIAKLYRLKVPLEQERIYREHTLQPAVIDATEATRRRRGFKITTSARGRRFDLDVLFDRLNDRYFDGRLRKPVLSWGQKPTHRVLGHHDHVHGAIILSPTLDDKEVPEFVVEYVLFHEMLHVRHKAAVVGNRTIYHNESFKADEKRFERLTAASRWLEEFAEKRRRRRRVAGSKGLGTKTVKRRS
jgi:hypothetical protein